MALTSIGGRTNIESDVALASGGSISASRIPSSPNQTTVVSVMCGPISTATGAQCGHISLRDGITVIARWYVFFTATAASQSSSVLFPVGLSFTPVTSLNLLYTAVTDATTASVSFVWST